MPLEQLAADLAQRCEIGEEFTVEEFFFEHSEWWHSADPQELRRSESRLAGALHEGDTQRTSLREAQGDREKV